MIDLVLEKWLAAYKKYSNYIEVFENPTIKEMKDIGPNFRWIADAKRRKVYMWDAMGSIHSDAWVQLKKELKDDRRLYKSGDLLTGVSEGGKVRTEALSGIPPKVRSKLLTQDWSFTERFFDVSDVVRRLG